jgi:Ca-activated chloride channel family protein
VVARLDDGATAEDVIFLNSPGTSERLDVNLVEMYVVVTDRDGRPVSGLDAADFRIFEEGEPREIASFADGRTLPLTVGLVIDSSASMFVKLPTVGAAASRFVSESLEDEDRAFVVGFGGDPELVQGTTSNGPDLMRSIDRLRADGQTAIWESVVYSLVQIQGTPGKKALVLYTDGADEDEEFPYEMALRFARRTGVPSLASVVSLPNRSLYFSIDRNGLLGQSISPAMAALMFFRSAAQPHVSGQPSRRKSNAPVLYRSCGSLSA